jgi:hypothetical protein
LTEQYLELVGAISAPGRATLDLGNYEERRVAVTGRAGLRVTERAVLSKKTGKG